MKVPSQVLQITAIKAKSLRAIKKAKTVGELQAIQEQTDSLFDGLIADIKSVKPVTCRTVALLDTAMTEKYLLRYELAVKRHELKHGTKYPNIQN